MTNENTSTKFRPMNVIVASGSPAEKAFRSRAGIPGLTPGVSPSPKHDLIFHGGKTIPNLTFTNFYVGGTESWQQGDIQSIDQALAAAMSHKDLNDVMAQYFPNRQIINNFQSSRILPGPAPAVISQGDVENMIRTLHGQELLNNFDLGSTVFNLMLPSGTILNTEPTPTNGAIAPQTAPAQPTSRHQTVVPKEEADSKNGLGGYHGSIHITRTDGSRDTVYYAVGVYSEQFADGTKNGIPVFDQPWKNVVATFYHELCEARTDTDVEDAIRAGNDPSAANFLGWTSQQGEECGDFPVFEANPLTQVFQEVPLTGGNGNVPVQFQYSNRVHGPEKPTA